jgi:hypothetical protein
MAMDAAHIRAFDARSRSLGGYALDERPRRNGAYDAVRSAIDQLEPEDIAELVESLLEERGENWGEDRRRAADSRRARDQGIGGPTSRTGGLEDPEEGAQDRRARGPGRAHDSSSRDERLLRLVPELANLRDEFGRPLWPSR